MVNIIVLWSIAYRTQMALIVANDFEIACENVYKHLPMDGVQFVPLIHLSVAIAGDPKDRNILRFCFRLAKKQHRFVFILNKTQGGKEAQNRLADSGSPKDDTVFIELVELNDLVEDFLHTIPNINLSWAKIQTSFQFF